MEPKRLRSTFAIDVCDKGTLLQLVQSLLITREPAFYRGLFGVALVHPKDRHYVKKLGRSCAMAAAKAATYNLMSAEPWQEGTKYHFAVQTTYGLIKLHLFTLPKSNVVHISYVDVLAVKRR